MSTVQLRTEHEIQSAYSGKEFAEEYVSKRFESELNRILHQAQVGIVNGIMQERQPAEALEIAPGPGRVTRDIVPANRLTCLEFNEGMIAEGKQRCKRVNEWVQGNAFELPFKSAQFNFVYSFRFIRHFEQDDRNRLYEQIKNVLAPGGTLVFDAVNQIQSQPLRDASPESYPIYDVLYQRNELLQELKAAGFEQIELIPVQRFYRLQYLSETLIGPRSAAFNRFIIRMLESMPRTDGLEWIVQCRRA